MRTILDYSNNREKCQKFTPEDLAKDMLNLAGYQKNLIGKKVLENSFGSGQILKCIVARYIAAAKQEGLSAADIKFGLENDIWGIELDDGLFRKCIADLNSLTEQEGIKNIEWKLYNTDALSYQYGVKFDYMIL